jgi:hypothetical protein
MLKAMAALEEVGDIKLGIDIDLGNGKTISTLS